MKEVAVQPEPEPRPQPAPEEPSPATPRGNDWPTPTRAQVEEASEYLYERVIVAYPYTTELPVEVLGAKYKWARGAGVL